MEYRAKKYKELYKKTRRIKLYMFINDFKRSKLGMAGIILLIIFTIISLLVVTNVIVPADFVKKWKTPKAWQDYPELVPPEWWLKLSGQPVFPQTFIVKNFNGKQRAVIPYNYKYDVFPTDAKIDINIFASNTSSVRVTVSLYRPDKEEIIIYDHVHNIVKGINQTRVTIFLRRNLEISRILLSHYGINNVNPEVADNIALLFGQKSANMWNIKKTKPLKGVYLFIVEAKSYEGKAEIKKTRVVLYANAYGLMGTDSLRRDLFLALLWGFPVSLFIGVVTSFLTAIVGVFYAIISAYYGGFIDEIMQRIVDIILSIPLLPILILVAMTFGPSIWLIIGLLVLLTWTGGIKTVRVMVFQIREALYIESARVTGASTRWIMVRHILPQVLPYAFYLIVIGVPGYILTEAGLSFLGLGDPNLPTWGQILHDAAIHGAALGGYWWWVVPPGLLIALVGLSFALIGVAVDKIINPKLKR